MSVVDDMTTRRATREAECSADHRVSRGMTEIPNDADATADHDTRVLNDDPKTLRDGDMPAPYPDDTPGGVNESGGPDGDETGDLAADAERLSQESDSTDSPS